MLKMCPMLLPAYSRYQIKQKRLNERSSANELFQKYTRFCILGNKLGINTTVLITTKIVRKNKVISKLFLFISLETFSFCHSI